MSSRLRTLPQPTRSLCCFLVMSASALLPTRALAHGLGTIDVTETSHHISFGGSVAYASHPGATDGVMHGFDFTYSPWLGLWLGGGTRSFENFISADRSFHPYVEAGIWLGVSVGGGYSLGIDGAPGAGAGPHWFIGLPLPLWPEGRIYMEPYYRVLYDDEDALNEVGLLLKWTNLFTERDRNR